MFMFTTLNKEDYAFYTKSTVSWDLKSDRVRERERDNLYVMRVYCCSMNYLLDQTTWRYLVTINPFSIDFGDFWANRISQITPSYSHINFQVLYTTCSSGQYFMLSIICRFFLQYWCFLKYIIRFYNISSIC